MILLLLQQILLLLLIMIAQLNALYDSKFTKKCITFQWIKHNLMYLNNKSKYYIQVQTHTLYSKSCTRLLKYMSYLCKACIYIFYIFFTWTSMQNLESVAQKMAELWILLYLCTFLYFCTFFVRKWLRAVKIYLHAKFWASSSKIKWVLINFVFCLSLTNMVG